MGVEVPECKISKSQTGFWKYTASLKIVTQSKLSTLDIKVKHSAILKTAQQMEHNLNLG